MTRTFPLGGPVPPTSSPFRLDGTVAELYGEAPYVEPEVPDRELELFESLHEQILEKVEPVGEETFESEWESETEHPISRFFRVPLAALEALGKGSYAAALTLLGSAGYRSVNDLTNIIFYFRRPAVIGRKIQPSEHQLQRDWLQIRDTIVRPALEHRASLVAPVRPTTSDGPSRTSISSAGLRWYGPGPATPQLMTFMRAVYDRQVSISEGTFVDTLPPSALKQVEGRHCAQTAAADAAKALLAAARADLAAEGHSRVAIGIISGYRSADRQFEIWQGKDGNGRRGFPYYYRQTLPQRQATGDEHGPRAVALLAQVMKRCIAAPGYSNHQDGLAFDFGTGRVGGGLGKIEERSWFHSWLVRNAERFDFGPYAAEPWHWVYRPRPTGQQEGEGWEPEAVWETETEEAPEAEWGFETGQLPEAEWGEEVEDQFDAVPATAAEPEAESAYPPDRSIASHPNEELSRHDDIPDGAREVDTLSELTGQDSDLTERLLDGGIRGEFEKGPAAGNRIGQPETRDKPETEDWLGAEDQASETDSEASPGDEAESEELHGVDSGLGESLADDQSEINERVLTEAALRGELLLDLQAPDSLVAAPPVWGVLSPADEGVRSQLLEDQQSAPVAATRVDVTVRTDFTVQTATGTRFDWAHGEPVRGARVQIVGTAISAVSDASGNLHLDTTGLRDGFHTIRIEHTVADQNSPDVAGPTLADPLTARPRRIYRPLNVWVGMRAGRITGAMVALLSPHGGLGNRSRATWDATHLPIDWKPTWMRSPMKATERPRATTAIDLIVVHRPNRSDIGPAINTFLNSTEVGNAHYLIDHNGHVIKMAEDSRRANHTGYSRWRGNGQLNAASIGIEVMRAPNGFTTMAMAALASLIERLRVAHPTIPAHRVVGHSDIATSQAHPTLLSNRRLEDPGRQFDWPLLERRGLGMVPGHAAVGTAYAGIFASGQPVVVLRNGDHDRLAATPARLGGVTRADVTGRPIAELQDDLEHIGYSVRRPGGALGRFDAHTVAAVDRFQRHFFAGSRESLRPTLGEVDVLTASWIRAVRPNIP